MEHWYTNWEMWGAVGQGLGAIGTFFAAWLTYQVSKRSVQMAAKANDLSEKSLEIAKESRTQKLTLTFTYHKTPTTNQTDWIQILATNSGLLPITIQGIDFYEVDYSEKKEGIVTKVHEQKWDKFISLNPGESYRYSLNLDILRQYLNSAEKDFSQYEILFVSTLWHKWFSQISVFHDRSAKETKYYIIHGDKFNDSHWNLPAFTEPFNV